MSILIFLFGIITGLTLALLTLWLFKVKCPNCKKLKPLKEIMLFSWKSRQITGQACLQCQKPKPQIAL